MVCEKGCKIHNTKNSQFNLLLIVIKNHQKDQNLKYTISSKSNESSQEKQQQNLFQLNMKKLSAALKSESFHLNYDNYEKRLYFSVSEIILLCPVMFWMGETNRY